MQKKNIKPLYLEKKDMLLQLLRNIFFRIHLEFKKNQNPEQDHLGEKDHWRIL